MKAPDFAYARPASLDEALALLAAHGGDAVPLAGGQSLITTLNMRLAAPALLVDLNAIPGLAGISEADGVVRIGAMTRHRDVGTDPLVRERLPLLAAALPHIAHPAIRNRGTIGGSVALADPATEWPACCLAGEATIVVRGPQAERRIAAENFFLGLYTTALEPGEIVTAVEFPVPGPDAVWGFEELSRRHGDYALAGLAATARRGAGGLTGVRLAFFGLADRPVLARAAAAAIEAGDVKGAQGALSGELDPPEDPALRPATRLHLARVILGRVAGRMLDKPAQDGVPHAV
ncbi:FAD binding domain-containing protein [Methylobacterium nonmethylotrophicum]|uniref:Xanthine dehydrogenase family protein subunit M n=1 Tax=Methylobacterium nonmethylotrophicum TaxID=1141884 RepID=A0A4Z0NPZ0_9HYPH|nr:xanthine dehydrogenase family protein subunit M [Methylobacterium nonmethylotrophicum]TGD98992.1 xanthine dehydrogenase family protein subunit M [Methylobacterium nonmethylotrophicum]